jgi:hypothetical protein
VQKEIVLAAAAKYNLLVIMNIAGEIAQMIPLLLVQAKI